MIKTHDNIQDVQQCTMKTYDNVDKEKARRRWWSDVRRNAWRQYTTTTYNANKTRICQHNYDYDFNFNDMQINSDDVPITKHGAQTAVPKCPDAK